MIRLPTSSFVLLLVFATLLAYTSRAAAGSEQDIAQATAAWADAYNRRDAARIRAQYAPDALFWGTRSATLADRPEQIGQYFLESVRNPNLRVTVNQQSIRVYGDVGISAGVYTVRDVKDGREVFTPGRFTFVFERRADAWVIVHHHSSRMPAP